MLARPSPPPAPGVASVWLPTVVTRTLSYPATTGPCRTARRWRHWCRLRSRWQSAFTTANGGTNGLEWPLINGWLLVEVKWASDQKWHGVTQEWLGSGLCTRTAGSYSTGTPYTAPASNAMGVYGSNYMQDHANAILYFQQTADRNGNNAINGPGAGTDEPLTVNSFTALARSTTGTLSTSTMRAKARTTTRQGLSPRQPEPPTASLTPLS